MNDGRSSATDKVEDFDGAFGQITCSFAMQLQ